MNENAELNMEISHMVDKLEFALHQKSPMIGASAIMNILVRGTQRACTTKEQFLSEMEKSWDHYLQFKDESNI